MYELSVLEMRDVLLPESRVLRPGYQDQDAAMDYPVACDCGYTGFREDCQRGECPNCGGRVRRS
jgi:hypothetical protein